MVGIDNHAASFHDVSLSNNTPIPPIQLSNDTEVMKSRKKLGRMIIREYLTVGVLFIVNLLNYMDRYTIAGVLPSVKDYYGIDDTYAGLLQTVFIVGFMCTAPIFAYFGDRYSRKIIMVVGLSIWGCAILGSSFIPKDKFWAFALLRGVVGVGEASYSVVAPTIIADLFSGVTRSRVLMIFYLAIPVGSGLGFVFGGAMLSLTGDWYWALRITPVFVASSIAAIVAIVHDPERGKAERDQGAEKVDEQAATSYWEDILYLLKNKTYVWSTIGYTSVVFVTGTLSWFTATAIIYATLAKENITLSEFDDQKYDPQKSKVALIFGVVLTLAGLFGVTIGTIWAQFWKTGRACFKGHHNVRADPLVCMIGSIVACPFLLLGMHMITVNEPVSWICIFIAVTFLCLNWSINVDMLLSIVVPTRRSVATGMQILISHLFGDAAGPYLIGLVSDWIRGSKTDLMAHFKSLLFAFYIPTCLLVISAICFGVSAWTLVVDKEKFDVTMGYKVKSQKSRTSRKSQSGSMQTT